jgi:plasmid stabilization system protein ParE
MEVRWTTEASSNLEHISLRIAEDNPEAALRTVRAIFQRIEQQASARELGAIKAIQTIHHAEAQYQSQYSRYANSLQGAWTAVQRPRHASRCRSHRQ